MGSSSRSRWEEVGEVAMAAAQITGLDAMKVVALIVKGASEAKMHKKRCKEAGEQLEMVGALLGQLKEEVTSRSSSELGMMNNNGEFEEEEEEEEEGGGILMAEENGKSKKKVNVMDEVVRVLVEKVEEELGKAAKLLEKSKNRSFLYLLALGWSTASRFRHCQTHIQSLLSLLPLITLLHLYTATALPLPTAAAPQTPTSTDPSRISFDTVLMPIDPLPEPAADSSSSIITSQQQQQQQHQLRLIEQQQAAEEEEEMELHHMNMIIDHLLNVTDTVDTFPSPTHHHIHHHHNNNNNIGSSSTSQYYTNDVVLVDGAWDAEEHNYYYSDAWGGRLTDHHFFEKFFFFNNLETVAYRDDHHHHHHHEEFGLIVDPAAATAHAVVETTVAAYCDDHRDHDDELGLIFDPAALDSSNIQESIHIPSPAQPIRPQLAAFSGSSSAPIIEDLEDDKESSTTAYDTWHNHLLDCCMDPYLCVSTCMYPCGTFSDVAAFASGGTVAPQDACNDFMTYSLLLSCFCYTSLYRQKLRHQYNIEGGCFKDFYTHFFCFYCALVQEWSEILHRDVEGHKMSPPELQIMERY